MAQPTPPSDAELVAALARAVDELGPYVSRDGYEGWRARQHDADALPSGNMIGRRLGGWTVARDRAAAHLAAEANGASPEHRPQTEATERT